MLKVGLTGGIGSGKSSVSDLFEKLGVPVIDTDVIAHDLVKNNKAILQQISDVFGADILKINGELNRKKLAKIIFHKKDHRRSLEKILHPEIKSEVISQVNKLSSLQDPPSYVIIVVPLLIEARYHDLVDRILVVIADETIRVARVKQRDNRSPGDIRAIIKNQADDSTRLKQADDTIENNSDISAIEKQVKDMHETYLHLSRTIT